MSAAEPKDGSPSMQVSIASPDRKLHSHLEQVPPDRIARAPYNFVPLPDKVVTVSVDSIPSHSRFDPNLYTGRIVCALKTETPLYTRAAFLPADFFKAQDEDEQNPSCSHPKQRIRNNPDFFHHGDRSLPWIPGSSLRGMVRSIIKIIGYGEIGQIDDQKLSYRAVGDTTRLGNDYRHKFLDSVGLRPIRITFLPKAGYLHWDNGNLSIKPATSSNRTPSFYRIEVREADRFAREHSPLAGFDHVHAAFFQPPAIEPHRHGQGRLEINYGLINRLQASAREGLIEGRLVRTGLAGRRKHLQFVFQMPQMGAQPLPISRELEAAFCEAMKDSAPVKSMRGGGEAEEPDPRKVFSQNGTPKEGCPVFYITKPGTEEVAFFGWTLMFRLAYGHDFLGRSPQDFSPAYPSGTSEEAKVDLADAIFGFVSKGSGKRKSFGGRVRVGSARCLPKQENIWLRRRDEEPIVPHIFGGPKPSCFQHYLVQTDSRASGLWHYGDDERTNIRGFKQYWHHDPFNINAFEQTDQVAIAKAEKQYTCMRPVNSGKSFQFTIWFENLRREELGVLLWALKPVVKAEDWDKDASSPYRQKLGMGKPRGLGSVRITPHLILEDRLKRYQILFDDEGFYNAPLENAPTGSYFVSGFDSMMRQALGLPQEKSIFEQDRIRELLAILRWEPLASGSLEYLKIGPPNEYKDRRILPLPSQIRQGRDLPLQGPLPNAREGTRGSSAHQRIRERCEPVQSPPTPARQVPPAPRLEDLIASPSQSKRRGERLKPGLKIWVKVTEKSDRKWILEDPRLRNGKLPIHFQEMQQKPEVNDQGFAKVQIKSLTDDGRIEDVKW